MHQIFTKKKAKFIRGFTSKRKCTKFENSICDKRNRNIKNERYKIRKVIYNIKRCIVLIMI